MTTTQQKHLSRIRRHTRVRAKISGTAERPRFTVFRGNAKIHAQLIDDVKGVTLVYVSDVGKKSVFKGTKTEKAQQIGKAVAEGAKAKGITKVVFDRGGSVYAGRIRAIAESARSAGLQF